MSLSSSTSNNNTILSITLRKWGGRSLVDSWVCLFLACHLRVSSTSQIMDFNWVLLQRLSFLSFFLEQSRFYFSTSWFSNLFFHHHPSISLFCSNATFSLPRSLSSFRHILSKIEWGWNCRALFSSFQKWDWHPIDEYRDHRADRRALR